MLLLRRSCVALLMLASSIIPLTIATTAPAQAAPVTSQIVLNPGGGKLADGSDGVRFVINGDYTQASQQGADAVHYRATRQYCCGAGAPMLNIGGTLFGQAGPAAYGSTGWTSLTLLSTTGNTVLGAATDATGNASATVRYVATKGGLEYVMERHVSYTYPNSFVTENYSFTIPEGNTEQVKFYLGGDTAPGGSDQGLGVMLTEPVRTVISLNPNSGIQFGFREMPGSKPFNGATSQSFSTPYSVVQAGGDIGFYAQPGPGVHDAGLMVQWNLGSTPGTQSASMQQFASAQGTNLTAGFDRELATAGENVLLNAAIENTLSTAASGLGFEVTLPAGTTVAAGAQSNACGGTLTAAVGSTSVTVTGGTVGALTNCVVSVPVVATTYGTYTMSSANVTTTGSLTNTVGTTSFFVPLAPEITTTALDTLTVGTPVTTAIASEGAPAPTFAVTTGSLPAGLKLDEETGAITGTPTAAGPYAFIVTATNRGGTHSRGFTGVVGRGTPGFTATAAPSSIEYGDVVALAVADLPSSATGTVTFTSGDTDLCSVTLPASTCDVPADLLPATYSVRAAYSGDVNWLSRAETVTSFAVSKAPTTASGTLSTDSSGYGDDVAVTVSVTPAAARGTVEVSSGGEALCTVTLPGSSCTIERNLAPGDHTIAVAYSGEARYAASGGQAGVLQVSRATPNPTPNAKTATYGDDLEFNLPGMPADATGTVVFRSGDEELCSYELGGSTASCTLAGGLPTGDHTVDAAYSGDDNFEPVTKQIAVTIEKASTSVDAPRALTSTYGQAATVTVTGLPAGATGSVEVSLGGEVLCTVAANNGSGCALPANLPAGEHTLLVSYTGDDNHLGSDAITRLTVEQAATAISTDATVRTDRNVPARIDVTGLPTDATGTVTVTHPVLGVVCSFDVSEADGCETASDIAPGKWELTASYSGDANHLGSEADVVLEVLREETQVETPPALEVVYGSPASIDLTGLPKGATGTVVVSYNDGEKEVVLCTVTLPGASSCELPAALAAGDYSLSISYSGDDNHAPSTSTTEFTVDKLTTAVVTADLVTTQTGEPATITASGLPLTATGTVTVSVAPAARVPAGSAARVRPDAGDELCSFDVTEATSCEIGDDIAAGSYALVISYSGDDNHTASQAAGRLVVKKPTKDNGKDEDDRQDETDADNGTDTLPTVGATFSWMVLPVGLALLVIGAAFVTGSRRRRTEA